MKKLISKIKYWLRPKCKCGHKPKVMEANIEAYGQKHFVRIKRHNLFRRSPFCLECLKERVIKCPWCGGAIFPGDYVTLYTPKDPQFKIPDGCVVYSSSPLRLVGCQARSCADSGADYCGRWNGHDVECFESALEECMRTGQPVIRNFWLKASVKQLNSSRFWGLFFYKKKLADCCKFGRFRKKTYIFKY